MRKTDRNEIYQRLIAAANTSNFPPTSIRDLLCDTNVSSGDFQRKFPPDTPDRLKIEELLQRNAAKVSRKQKQNWFNNPNPTLQIALFRLNCTPDERQRISQNYTDVTTNGKDINNEPCVFEIIDRREQVDKKNDR